MFLAEIPFPPRVNCRFTFLLLLKPSLTNVNGVRRATLGFAGSADKINYAKRTDFNLKPFGPDSVKKNIYLGGWIESVSRSGKGSAHQTNYKKKGSLKNPHLFKK